MTVLYVTPNAWYIIHQVPRNIVGQDQLRQNKMESVFLFPLTQLGKCCWTCCKPTQRLSSNPSTKPDGGWKTKPPYWIPWEHSKIAWKLVPGQFWSAGPDQLHSQSSPKFLNLLLVVAYFSFFFFCLECQLFFFWLSNSSAAPLTIINVIKYCLHLSAPSKKLADPMETKRLLLRNCN